MTTALSDDPSVGRDGSSALPQEPVMPESEGPGEPRRGTRPELGGRAARASLSPATQRAQRLLIGGLVGGHLGAAAGVIVPFLLWGPAAFFAALLGSGLAFFFEVVGQVVQIRVADARPTTVLAASLASYVGRVAVLGVVLAALLRVPPFDTLPAVAIPAPAFAIGLVATVMGWLFGVVQTYRHLRIPIYDDASEVDRG